MKHAISVSIGSSRRDKSVELEILGKKVHVERRGTDGDMRKAASLFTELDGKVDALGVGGTDLGLLIDRRWYPMYSVAFLVEKVSSTPVVDGCGLKTTLERQAAGVVDQQLNLKSSERKCLIVSGADRWGMAKSFIDAGYECVFGDMMFALNLPFPLHSESSVKRLAAALLPIAGRLPFQWIYPIGKEQEKRTPRWEKYYQNAKIIAGDCHYIRRYMPARLDGKVIVTNTTTPEDMQIFRQAGVKKLITTTPVLEGRSFGTNMMEAAILAAMGRTSPVDYSKPGDYFDELADVVTKLRMAPQVHEL